MQDETVTQLKLTDAALPNREAAIQRLEQEIRNLHMQQTMRLQRATYLGMTPDEGKEYDASRSEIVTLWQQLVLRFESAE
jgi:hypothetical protein